MRVCFVLCLLLGMFDSTAADLSGTLRLFANGKPLRESEAAEAIIYFRPNTPVLAKPAATPFVMTTRRKQFVPRVLAITAGSSVRFPNEDPILHNAFSTSPENAFDTGQYSRGDGRTQVFGKPGLVRVYCNVHHSMIGHILVLDTPYFTHPDAQGRFTLGDLPEEAGDLVVWHDRAKPWHVKAVPGKTAASEVILDLNLRRIPQHMNKFGKPYGRSDSAAY